MKRLSIAILAAALEILSAPPGLMAAEDLSQTDLAAHIMDLGKFDIETSRRDLTLTDCALVGRRLDLFREDEEPPKTDQLNLDDVVMPVQPGAGVIVGQIAKLVTGREVEFLGDFIQHASPVSGSVTVLQ